MKTWLYPELLQTTAIAILSLVAYTDLESSSSCPRYEAFALLYSLQLSKDELALGSDSS